MKPRWAIVGQVVCIGGLLLLLAYIPFAPRTLGAPRHRILEMALFWLGESLMLLGSGKSLQDAMTLGVQGKPLQPRALPILAALGVLIAAGMSLIALGNLLYSTIQGVGLRPPGAHSGVMYPRELGYALALPLLLTIALQVPLAIGPRLAGKPSLPPHPTRVVRLVLLIALAVAFLAFLAACFFCLAERRFVVVAVAATSFAGLIFLVLAFEQLIWTLVVSERILRSTLPPPPPISGGYFPRS